MSGGTYTIVEELEAPGAGVDISAFARQFGGQRQYAYHYTKAKLRMDPLYPAAYQVLAGRDRPLLDLGCGMGVLAFYLRQRGYAAPILGIDYDARKISAAQAVAGQYEDLEFRPGDAREFPEDFTAGDVSILDILQFFNEAEQTAILGKAAALALAAVGSTPGRVVIRSTVRDDSRRFRVSQSGDLLAKLTFWMKDAPTCYPTVDTLAAPFREAGFHEMIRPCWGRTSFNNYLLVFTAR